jgi:hypothetical protein
MSDRDDDQRDDDEKCVPEVQVIRHTLLILFIVAVTDSPAEIFVLKNVGEESALFAPRHRILFAVFAHHSSFGRNRMQQCILLDKSYY